MRSHARSTKSAPSSPPAARGRYRTPASITHPDRATPITRVAEPKKAKAAPNPLWVINVGMGAFFVAVALIMMFD